MPTQRAHDARSDRRTSRETQRISDRQDRLAHLELVRIGVVRGSEFLPVDPHDRDVRFLVPADDRPAQDTTVREGDDHFFSAIDDVVRGEDVALVVKDHAGSESAARPLPPWRSVGPLRRAHVHRARPRPLDRLNVCVLQICQHGLRQSLGGVC